MRLDQKVRIEKLQAAIARHPGYTVQQLGDFFGVSKQRISQLLRWHGIPYHSKKWGPRAPLIPKKALLQAIAEGKSQVEFAKECKRSWDTVRKSVKASKVKWPRKIGNEKVKLKDLKAAIAEHPDWTMGKLAQHFGVCAPAILTRIRNNGLKYKKKRALGNRRKHALVESSVCVVVVCGRQSE